MIEILLLALLCSTSFGLGLLVERNRLIAQLNRARRSARAADQVALSEVMRVLRGRS